MTPYWINIWWTAPLERLHVLESEVELFTSEADAIEDLAQCIDAGHEWHYIHTIAVVGEQLATLLDLRPAAREVLSRWRADEKQRRAEQTAQRL